MGKRSKGFPGNQSDSRNRNSGGVGKSGTNIPQKATDPVEKIQSNEQANALLPQALEKLLPQELEAIGSSAPDDLDPNELWKNAQIFALAAEQLASREKEFESLQAELKVKQAELDDRDQESAEQSKLLHDEREQLNQWLAEIGKQERQLQEREANAVAGFLVQNRVALAELDQQVEQLSSEVTQALSRKLEIQQQLKDEITQKYAEFEQEVLLEGQAIEEERQQLITERRQLRKEQNKLGIERELLHEDRESLEEKVEHRAAAKVESLEANLRVWKERYEKSQELQRSLEANLLKAVDAVKRFGQRNPEEILAELTDLRRRNEELEQKLAERLTEAAVERLRSLEDEKESWDRDRFNLQQEVSRLRKVEAVYQTGVLDFNTLQKQKEALETSNNRLQAALDELRRDVNDAISQSKERSPFEKCTQMDRDDKLQISPILSREVINLAQFAEDLRFRIALSPQENGKRLYYSEQDIRAFLGGIAMSKLHILQGISGTGKTSLPLAFARAMGQRGQANYRLVEVQAGWRDRQDLLGYYNSFEGKYYETDFLTALYEAQCPEFQDQIYIIILDEMNLSRPEQYFADFLSKLEQDAPTLRLNTDLDRPVPKLFRGNDTLVIPPNVWFVGTANQDETTLEFADKTYDRAHVMELARSHESFDIPQLPPRHPISYEALTNTFKEAQKQHGGRTAKAFSFLNNNLSDLLERKFKVAWGNRLERQMHHYVPIVLAAGGSLTEATDHILATKILRKVRDRHDTQPADLRELHETIEEYWSELDTGKPVKSLKLLESELQRVERGAY
ncbi:hypothetical protein H6F90_03805 [Trichocoleus sp. FACHB-591]|uniref:hypothetical protein n=1 Tax=Trichocoleus sp. FACHB-591 TaxID=2692872 RepID=UPI001682F9F2|nr:hypothetical protein [Trichocoleus sp. FACHB-591]MBD2094272.1 hypothetical protein [Trichocoleus sp. FACHB-591]